LHEPPGTPIPARQRPRHRPYAIGKPGGYEVRAAGAMVELDTLDVRPLPCPVLKHFTARDAVSRWDVLEARSRATATAASSFINTLLERMPFPIKAIQEDGGSEFRDAFERECRRRGGNPFRLPAPLAQAQRSRGASPQNPYRGVL